MLAYEICISFSSLIHLLSKIRKKRLRCTFCYAHAKLNELPETLCKTLFHCENCNVNLCFSPDRDYFTKWHSTEDARVRALVTENGMNKDH